MVRWTAERRKRKKRRVLPVFLGRTAAKQVSAGILDGTKRSGPRTEPTAAATKTVVLGRKGKNVPGTS